MSRLHGGRVLIAVALIVAASIGAAYATGRLPGREAGGGYGSLPAADDEEWLALIESARQARANLAAPWPEGLAQEGVKVLHSCGAVPAGAAQTEMAIEYSPDGGRRRLVVMYLEPPASRYQLILYADGDLSGCNEGLKAAVTGPDQHKADVDAHICEQMKLMAQGLPPTDKTLRPASPPPVAAAYIAALCPQ